jgi:murein DD-endopeptidase MepM/ murein hydrolase activator NlpD
MPVIDLGAQPPLRLAGSNARPQIHPVSLRWLSGTILTGFAGVALMGAAIFTAMHGEALLAKTPGFAQPRFATMLGERISNALHKSDRIVPHRAVHEDRQTFRISSISRVGDHEVVHTRPVTLVSASLTTGGVDSAKYPSFNPLSLFDDGGAKNADPGPEPDGDISYMLRDLRRVPIAADEGLHQPLAEVMARVGEAAALAALHRVKTAATQHGDPGGTLALAGGSPALPGGAKPLASSAALSNMTVLVKAAARAAPAPAQHPTVAASRVASAGEQVVVVKPGDTLDRLLTVNGASDRQAGEIVAALRAQSASAKLAAGSQVRILLTPHPGDANKRDVARVTLSVDGEETSVVQSDTGGYAVVAGAVPLVDGSEDTAGAETGDTDDGPGGSKAPRLYDSFYATARAKGIPDKVIQELIHIYGYDADFKARVSEGDGFQVLYASDMQGKVAGANPEILYSTLIEGGETKRFYRFQLPDGSVGYFDQDGRSTRKFLLRKPVPSARFSRGFGMERHPILGVMKMHTGVDWAAPRGTPIFAAGNGTVEYDKWVNGYGRQIRLQHSNGYETSYAHMSAFARGIKAGVHVRQGQIIGYVGSTGLSTGPHVHFEVIVNGRFVNPMRIRVPRERELKGDTLVAFEQARHRLDDLAAHGAAAPEAIAGTGAPHAADDQHRDPNG